MNFKSWVVVAIVVMLLGSTLFLQHRSSAVEHTIHGQWTVTDDAGKEVTVPVPAKRIVSLVSSDSELLVALGVDPVGAVSSGDLPKNVQEKLATYPNMGSAISPNIEKIMEVKPDFVIGLNMPFQTFLRNIFNANGIPIYFHAADSYHAIERHVLFVGKVADREKEAEALVQSYKDTMERIRSCHEGEPKKRILIVFGSPSSYQLATSNTYVGDIFKRLGAINVADEYVENAHQSGKEGKSFISGFIPLNLETMTQIHCDEVLIINHGGDAKATNEFKKAFKTPAWTKVPAVREGKIRVLPANLFSYVPTARMNDVFNFAEEVLYGKS